MIYGRTMAFAVLGLSQLVHSFNVKSGKSPLFSGIGKNKYLVASFIICSIMQLGVIILPWSAPVFKVAALSGFNGLWLLYLVLFPQPYPKYKKPF